ncbi:MAG: PDZ domain-containing protein, partial [Acidobacteriota bacterium]|nr:PDZ domain-containing protein [Acidobacteriota bacterium]
KLLWVAEGATSYYEWLLKRRADIVDAKAVLRNFASIAESLAGRPGRFQTSLEEASFDAWIKAYRPDENAINNQISYYSKGELVNFLLDLQIRAGSDGAKSLDDVMRYLYAENYKKGKTYTARDYQNACELMAGKSLDGFFSKYVRGREEIAYDDLLRPFGLRMVTLRPESDNAYFGANLSNGTGGVSISSIPVGTPAYEAGLNSDDLIIAVDGYQVSNTDRLTFFLNEKKAGDKVEMTIFRHRKIHELEVGLGKTPASGYAIMPVPEPDDSQRRLYKDYFLEDLD